MFSVHRNSHIKLWINQLWKRSAKNNKSETIYKKYNHEGINFPSEKRWLEKIWKK